ncbi:UNVERIFIED_CONTAM: polymer-forming cytoskeletal protein [Spiribacter pallidus]|jgi:cytoskeletal protein CcmA (bactofilin family)
MWNKAAFRLRAATPAGPEVDRSDNDPVSESDGTLGPTLEPEHPSSVISEGVIARGDISSPGSVHVNGALTGDVEADVVHVGRNGSLEGNVQARQVTVAGQVNGELRCEQASLRSTALLTGSIEAFTLQIEAGAITEGRIRVENRV